MEASTSDWTSGYVADIAYTYGYYTELNPNRIKLAFAHAGLVAPTVGTACELGFGQGLSANVHAAGAATEWHGTDFNPSQASFAQELAAASGNRASLRDEAFADFCSRPDLPDFDFIGLHGIWSWISDENRKVIVDFVRRKLKVGGVLYISYNTMPGWAAFAPMRHLLNEHADIIGAEGSGIVRRIDEALGFADKLLEINPSYVRANPQVAERLKGIKGQNRHYLAHEYFNRDWHPMHFGTLSQWLAPAKVSFACSANLLDHVDAINLTQEQQAFLTAIPDSSFREAVRDFVVNQQFRKDYWVKGARKVHPGEQNEQLRSLRFVLCTPVADMPLKVSGSLGEATLSQRIYQPIIDAASNYKPITIGELERKVASKEVSYQQIVQAVLILTGAGHMAPAQDEADVRKAREVTRKLNAAIRAKARASSDIGCLASPVTGGAVNVGRFSQLFLTSLAAGKKSADAWAQEANNLISAQGQRVAKEGQVLSPEDQLAELKRQAAEFESKWLPLLTALEVV